MTKILLRRNNNAELTGVVLSSGEPAFALDLNVLKIGDGITAWENLDPIGDSGSVSAAAVSSLNGLTGGINILGGTDLEVTAAGSSITIDYTGVGGGGGVVTETDPVFTGSPAYNITNTDISNWNSAYNADVVVSGDNISLLTNDAGYLDAHPTISAASSSNTNTGNTFIQNITLDSNGHITGLTAAVATSGGSGGSGIQSLSEDPDPTLGGNLVTSTYFVSGNLIPYSNSTFDLGTAERKWRHLYLSNNSLKFVDESETTYALGVDVETGNLIYGADSGVLIKENDNVGLLDANKFYDYSLGSGTTGSFNPGASSKVNLVRVTTTGDLIIQGILPPTNSSSKLYNPFKLISNTSNEIRLKHNAGTVVNRLYFDSAIADGTEIILRQGESVDLIYLSGIVGTGPDSYRWYSTLNQNELNGDVVAGTGISLVYSTGTNELEISTNLYSVPDGIAGASGVNNIVVMGSGDYTALTTKNPTTLYFIT